jgi:DNA-binding MarR family transcriptional regulator
VDDLVRGCLGFRLGSAYRRVDRMFNRAFRSVGLAHAHGQVLACLLQEGEMRARDVASRTGFDQSVVSRLVRELGRRKLVRRKRDPDDGRSMLLRPSRRAEALREPIRRLLERVNGRLRRDLAQADLEGFERVTDVMARLP